MIDDEIDEIEVAHAMSGNVDENIRSAKLNIMDESLPVMCLIRLPRRGAAKSHSSHLKTLPL